MVVEFYQWQFMKEELYFLFGRENIRDTIKPKERWCDFVEAEREKKHILKRQREKVGRIVGISRFTWRD